MKKTHQINRYLFLVLCIINLTIFVERDHFQYRPYATKEELYGKDLKKWKAVVSDFGNDEMEYARTELSAANVIQHSDSVVQKVIAIADYLRKRLKNNPITKPNDTLLNLNTFQAYSILTKDHNQPLWCGTYSQIFALFCSASNILCRYIEIHKPGDHHVFNECYIPERNQWVLVDLTNNVLMVQNDRHLLSTLDFRKALATNTGIFWVQSSDSTPVKNLMDKNAAFVKAYYLEENPYYYHNSINLKQVYEPLEKIKRYLLPVSWYNIYSNSYKSNALFFIKSLFFFLWIASGIYLIKPIFSTNYDRSKRPAKRLR